MTKKKEESQQVKTDTESQKKDKKTARERG